MDNLSHYLAFAETLAERARGVLRAHLDRDRSHRLKSDGSFGTDIDLAIEDMARAAIAAAFPDHGILGEERPETSSESRYRWVVDPIDGTRSLRHRIPLFGTLVALLDGDESVVGVIDLPMLDRRYTAARGLGAQVNGRPIHLEPAADGIDVAQEAIAIGERRQFTAYGCTDVFDRLMAAHGSVRTYCDCFGHALAIEGSAGAMVDYDLRLWDLAASEVLVREAGGQMIKLDRSSRSNRPGGHYDVIFGKPKVVEWIVATTGMGAT